MMGGARSLIIVKKLTNCLRWLRCGRLGALATALDGRGRLLDVGCGPGVVTLAMARFFTEVVGADPDEDMLAEAERQARRRGVTNARRVAARAEELPAGLGEFRVVVFGVGDLQFRCRCQQRTLGPGGQVGGLV